MSYISCKPIELSEMEQRHLVLTEENRKLREDAVTFIKEFHELWEDYRALVGMRRRNK